MQTKTPEQAHLLEQLQHIAAGIGQTFAPFCEVVVHDLLEPEHAIRSIHNNLSGRAVGEPATELGLARLTDPAYPQILANYANQFSDGRQAKSTSVGIKDAAGNYVAALCLNVDLSLIHSVQGLLAQFGSIGNAGGAVESLAPSDGEALRAHIDAYSARHACTPRSLTAPLRRGLMQELKAAGLLERRRAMETIAAHLGIARATVYNYAK